MIRFEIVQSLFLVLLAWKLSKLDLLVRFNEQVGSSDRLAHSGSEAAVLGGCFGSRVLFLPPN